MQVVGRQHLGGSRELERLGVPAPTPSRRQRAPVATATWSNPYESTSSAVDLALERRPRRSPAARAGRAGSRRHGSTRRAPAAAASRTTRPPSSRVASASTPRSRACRAPSPPRGRPGRRRRRAPSPPTPSGAMRSGMPAAPPLLAHRRVLGAADRRHGEVAGDADVAADALADVLEPALLDLPRQERIGDRGARGADQVEHPVADEPHHRVRRGEAADADDRLRGQLLDAAEVRLLPSSPRRSGRCRVVLPAADHHVPEIGQLADEADDLLDLAPLEPVLAEQLVDASLHATAARPSTSASVSSSTSRRSRARFSRLPPYSSVRWL